MRLHKLFEGYKVLPSIDRERYQERDGLEGPFRAANGKVYYYDAKEGKPYDPDTDMYIGYDDFEQMDKDRDFNESADGAAGPDYEDPEGRFVIVSDGNKYFALGVGQYGDALPLTDRGFRSVDDAVEDAEEILGEALGESPAWDAHNTDVRPERGHGKAHDSTSFIVRNKAKKKRSKTKFPSWKDAMAFAAKFGGVKAGWEVVSEATGEVVTEGSDTDLYIEVSVRSARKANEALEDARIPHETDGSNLFIFRNVDDLEEALEQFDFWDIEIVDVNDDDGAPSWDSSSDEDDYDLDENWATKAMAGKSKTKKYKAPKDDEETDRAKRLKKKMYGSMMGGLEEAEIARIRELAGINEEPIERGSKEHLEYIAKKKHLERTMNHIITGDPSRGYTQSQFNAALQDPQKKAEYEAAKAEFDALKPPSIKSNMKFDNGRYPAGKNRYQGD